MKLCLNTKRLIRVLSIIRGYLGSHIILLWGEKVESVEDRTFARTIGANEKHKLCILGQVSDFKVREALEILES